MRSGSASLLAAITITGAAACVACGGETTPAAPATPPVSTTPAPPTTAAPVATNEDPSKAVVNGDAGAAEPTAKNEGPSPEAVKAANTFALKLTSKSLKAQGNALVSGSSLRQALAATYLGARGDTAKEMASALDLAGDPAAVAQSMKSENTSWETARGKAELVNANRVWVEKTFAPKADFTALAASAFGGAPEGVDFKTAPDAARKTINAWVSQKTNEKIPELLGGGAVDKQSRLVVTNAIYFRGRWPLPFPAGATKEEAFKIAPGRTSKVKMMHATEQYRFASIGGTKVLEMRYEGSDTAMLLVMPDDASQMSKVEGSLSPETFESWTKPLTHQRVNVSLPKFTFKSGGSMNATLKDLGIKSAFTDGADFSGITDPASGTKLSISQVVQQTFVAVDEQGTEAAAATGVVMHTTSLQMGQPAEFKADHPFLFFVYDAKRGRILFSGRVSDPK